MAKTISIIGLLITTVGGIMLVISAFWGAGMNSSLIGQASGQSPGAFLLVSGIIFFVPMINAYLILIFAYKHYINLDVVQLQLNTL